MITRIEKFRGNRIVVSEPGFLVGIALKVTGTDHEEFDLYVDRHRVIKSVAQYFANTEIHPVPFPVHHPVKRDSVLEIQGSFDEAVAYFTTQSLPDLLHAEGFAFAISNPAAIEISPGSYDKVLAIMGAEHDTSYTFLPASSAPVRVWVDGDLRVEGPMHAAVSRPGYLRELDLGIRQNLTMEANVTAPNKPKAVALFVKKLTTDVRKPLETA